MLFIGVIKFFSRKGGKSKAAGAEEVEDSEARPSKKLRDGQSKDVAGAIAIEARPAPQPAGR